MISPFPSNAFRSSRAVYIKVNFDIQKWICESSHGIARWLRGVSDSWSCTGKNRADSNAFTPEIVTLQHTMWDFMQSLGHPVRLRKAGLRAISIRYQNEPPRTKNRFRVHQGKICRKCSGDRSIHYRYCLSCVCDEFQPVNFIQRDRDYSINLQI